MRCSFYSLLLVLLFLCGLSGEESPTSSTRRVYPNRFDSGEHPDYGRFAVTPPSWETFGGKTQFICLRGISLKKNDETGRDRIVKLDGTYKPFKDADLGRIIWPHQSITTAENIGEFADWAKQNDLFVFDIWGYVPGSGPLGSGDWIQNRPDPEFFATLEEKLGDHWLGMDNGEQDGRYIGRYAPADSPINSTRFEQYLNFQRHFERLGDDLGNRLSTLVSLNFGHYFLKEGIYSLIGAETAQGLPNSQVYYSWIRGAGKEYGVLWFGNASIYNRWGFKAYPGNAEDGTSLSLLKRLIYSHILYNSAGVGFENGWFVGNELSPIGKIQRDAVRWYEQNGDSGTMVTQAALLSDFYCGWSFPRHLYSGKFYYVWGNIPYGPGDYLNNNLLDLIYPGYQNSSYYHDETGFLTATPYGDTADSLLSDAPLWLLNRYPLVILADQIRGGDPRRNREGGKTDLNPELIEKLTAYVQNGGRLLMTAGNLEALDGIFGMKITGEKAFPAESRITFAADGKETAEPRSFKLLSVTMPEKSRTVASCGYTPAAFEFQFGAGSVLVLNTPFAVSEERAFEGEIHYQEDAPLPNPYPLLLYAEKICRDELDKAVLFDVGADLGSIICRKSDFVWRIGLFNNGLTEKPFKIESRIGEIDSVRELPVTTEERESAGFLPKGFEKTNIGRDTETTIAGGAVRIFEVTLKNEEIELIPDTPIPPRPHGRYLALRNPVLVKEEVLACPTFFQHYDGVMLDWRYVEARTEEEMARESGWLRRHGLRIAVDFTSGINLYPDLRLIKNDPAEYERSMKTIKETIRKSALLGADRVILTSHQFPENNYTKEQNDADAVETFRELTSFAAEKGMTICLRTDTFAIPSSLDTASKILEEVNAPNFKLAPRLSFLTGSPEEAESLSDKIEIIFSSGDFTEEETAFLNAHPEIPCVVDNPVNE